MPHVSFCCMSAMGKGVRRETDEDLARNRGKMLSFTAKPQLPRDLSRSCSLPGQETRGSYHLLVWIRSRSDPFTTLRISWMMLSTYLVSILKKGRLLWNITQHYISCEFSRLCHFILSRRNFS